MSLYKKISIPDHQRVFFVGDIHGSYDLYQKGCRDLGITDEDVVVSLGDLIDRGPKNLPAVEEFTRKPNRYAILGNHEDMMIKGMLEGDLRYYECWIMNGGTTTWVEVGGEQGSYALSEMVYHLPVMLEVEHQGKTFGCVHAELPSNWTWQDVIQKAKSSPVFLNDLVWGRNTIDLILSHRTVNRVAGIDYVLHGHTPVAKPIVHGNRCYLDTGGVFNGKLSFSWYENGQLNFYTTGDHDNL